MIQPLNVEDRTMAVAPTRRQRWLGLPVIQPTGCSLTAVLDQLPHFGRQPFTMSWVNGLEMAVNPYLDMIYRLPSRQGEVPVPVGVVSKNYRLMDHHHVLRVIAEVLADSGIDPARLEVGAEWTVHCERARFSLIFPSDTCFKFELGGKEGKDEMRFRIEVFNSVEGSCRLMVIAGWLRFVCSNGLILGTTLMQLRQQHRQQLQIEEFGRILREAIQSVEVDRRTVTQWLSKSIDRQVVIRWVDEDVRNLWGFKAAVRVFGLVMHGYDVVAVGELKNRKPSEMEMRKSGEVPGVSGPATKIFAVSQVLSWLAGQRGDLAEDLEWRSEVPDLLDKLIRYPNNAPSLMPG